MGLQPIIHLQFCFKIHSPIIFLASRGACCFQYETMLLLKQQQITVLINYAIRKIDIDLFYFEQSTIFRAVQ